MSIQGQITIWGVFKVGNPKEMRREERFKWRVDGRSSWDEFQEAIEEEFQGWEAWVRDMEIREVGEELVERVWGERKTKVMSAVERGIGKKRISVLSKDWWSKEVEEAIQTRREACKWLRQARRRGGAVNECWKTYREKRRQVKKVIRKEKKKNRKNKLQKIKEQGGPSCKLFWSDLQGKKKNRRITRMRGKDGAVVEETEQILEVLAKHALVGAREES